MMATDRPFNVSAETIAQAVACLRAGDLVAMPTETVYGLAADASNPDAVAKVYALKGRPSDRPLIVHLASERWLSDWALEVPDYARRWVSHFWPGPLTLVFLKKPSVLDCVTGGQSTVALRVPNHPVALTLLKAFGGGLVAPSANRYGHVSPTTALAVREEFGAHAPLVLDGGPCQIGIESTIVSCVDDRPQILRLGMIGIDALEAVGKVRLHDVVNGADIVVPGQDVVHYSPNTRCVMLDYGAELERDLEALVAQKKVGFMGWHQPTAAVSDAIVLAADPDTVARGLYAGLRSLDHKALDLILVESPPPGRQWDAIRDRLARASVRSL